MGRDSLPITAIVLTYNEERNLGRCLESLRGWVREIFVVDSGSTDGTAAIAERYGARVVHHPFETHARQWIWAFDNLRISHEWILALDADQRVTPELRAELAELFTEDGPGLARIDGFYIKRRQVFRGRWIKHGGYYPKYLVKLVRRDKVFVDSQDLLDHHFCVPGRVEKLRHDLIEENQKEDDISFWIDKHNRYATLLAREELERKGEAQSTPLGFFPEGTPDQRARWWKRVWARLPLYVRPFLYFGYRYVVRLGFLDGKQGFIFHFLQACWFRLLVDIKIEERWRQRRLGMLDGNRLR